MNDGTLLDWRWKAALAKPESGVNCGWIGDWRLQKGERSVEDDGSQAAVEVGLHDDRRRAPSSTPLVRATRLRPEAPPARAHHLPHTTRIMAPMERLSDNADFYELLGVTRSATEQDINKGALASRD